MSLGADDQLQLTAPKLRLLLRIEASGRVCDGGHQFLFPKAVSK